MTLWHLGHTTVRTPYRLRDALRVLQGSPLNGNITGREQENEFAILLHREGVVDAPRVEAGNNASDLGRKWRSALSQLGFITPQLTRSISSGAVDPALLDATEGIEALSGRAYEITPNGYRLAKAEIITAQQECFLRAFGSYRIPSVIELRYKMDVFSPLRYILRILHGLDEQGQDSILSFQEFSLFVQTTTPATDIGATVQKIIEHRAGRIQAKGKGPAYLEWIVWRAFLAIDSSCNHPWETRRFQIDQDFLPVHCAQGGGPDMVFEFDHVVIVVEVTLTASSRQEAAEGEPVRRHVAEYTQTSNKPVYGLFIAVEIDSNTAHTFRSGDWYLEDDNKLTLDIVPLTLGDFGKFFASGEGRLSEMPRLLQQMMIECRAKANQDAPQWKQSISQIVERYSG